MNTFLQRLFSEYYHPLHLDNTDEGASSVKDTAHIRKYISDIINQYQIKSMFDAGCNDCNWMHFFHQLVDYRGGEISLGLVADVWRRRPDLNVCLHDITTDPLPNVDLLFVRDVSIHLNNSDRSKLWNNWFRSQIPWILITHNPEVFVNEDIEYTQQSFPFSPVNWNIDPWNFPLPMVKLDEYSPGGKCLALWNRDQFKKIL